MKEFACPNCGAPTEGGNERCSNCGWYLASLENPRRAPIFRRSGSRKAVVITLMSLFVVAPLALIGGCFLMFGGLDGDILWASIGLIPLALGALALKWAIGRKP